MNESFERAEVASASVALFVIDGTAHSLLRSESMTWLLPLSSGAGLGVGCSDRVAQPVGVEDGCVDVAAGDGATDAIELARPVRVVSGGLRPEGEYVGAGGDGSGLAGQADTGVVVEAG
jgi:hypothetical protein